MAPFPSLIFLLALLGPSRQVLGAAEKPSLVFDGFKARGTLKGVKQWEAEATHARIFHGSQLANVEDVTIIYFQKGRPVSRATAKDAQINLKTYDLEAEGDVVVHGQNGVILSTERLSWDNVRERVHTLERVRVVRGNSVLTGRGLVADRRLENVKVLEDVKVESANVRELRKMKRETK
jgi:LPS export ABC transporter protein LptC